jgi:hypothetical protein
MNWKVRDLTAQWASYRGEAVLEKVSVFLKIALFYDAMGKMPFEAEF